MRTRLAVLALVLAAMIGVVPGDARAARGGWAIASYDPLPALVAGETADVSFRILQHGVHPIVPAEWPGLDVRLEVTGPDGTVSVPATPDATPGRFVAAVAVPEDVGEIALNVVWDDGLVLPPNSIDVPVAAPADPSARFPDWLPGTLVALAVASAGVAAVDLARTLRRRPVAPSAPSTPA